MADDLPLGLLAVVVAEAVLADAGDLAAPDLLAADSLKCHRSGLQARCPLPGRPGRTARPRQVRGPWYERADPTRGSRRGPRGRCGNRGRPPSGSPPARRRWRAAAAV